MKSPKLQYGFTLIELMVTMGIIIIISSIVLTNFREGDRRTTLSLKSQQLVADLREMQNNAQVAASLASGPLPLSYGIVFIRTESQYRLFAETSSPNYQYNVSDVLIETVQLGDYTISQINGGACSNFNVGFAVPSADIYFNGGQQGHSCGGNNPSTIELTDKHGNHIMVEINWISGQISHGAIY